MSSRTAVARLLAIDPAAANPRELTRWLVYAHPDDVSRADIERQVARQEARIASHHQVGGLVFPLVFEPAENGRVTCVARIDAVADTALFNDIRLAGLVARYRATGDPSALREVGESIDAVYALTHLAGVPGLLTRYAVPLEVALQSRIGAGPDGHRRNAFTHVYYRDPRGARPEYAHLANIVAGRGGLAPVARSPLGRLLAGEAHYGDHYLYTRTSRDQLTGIVFGLAFAMKAFEGSAGVPARGAERELWTAIRQTLSRTAVDVYAYLRAHGWRLLDPVTGDGGRASDVSGLLRAAVELLFRRALMNQWAGASWRDGSGPALAEQLGWLREDMGGGGLPRSIEPRLWWARMTWPFTSRYYAWHLRLLRLVSILVLDAWHPASLADPPPGWPVAPLTRDATLARNRAWLRQWRSQWASFPSAEFTPPG